ncbi:MAG: hypothetical protein MR436_10600 [Eubacterium sp.]|nr:hypothetical protein [Eubacterium sp.]
MKSEKNESVSVEETVVNGVVQVAKADVEERQKIISYTFAGTTVFLSVLEILLSINWNAESLALSANVPWIVIVPGILMILYDIICKARGKKSYGAWAIGFCLLLIPIIVIGAAFLICGIFMGK